MYAQDDLKIKPKGGGMIEMLSEAEQELEQARYEQVCNLVMFIKDPEKLKDIRALCYDRYKLYREINL